MQRLAREQNFNKAEEYPWSPFQLTIFDDLLQNLLYCTGAPLLYGEVQVRT